jgi:hypothetical protein
MWKNEKSSLSLGCVGDCLDAGRTIMAKCKLLALTILSVAIGGKAPAQWPSQDDDSLLWEDNAVAARALGEREFARAIVEASSADIRKLKAARLEAARGWYKTRMEELEAGKTTVDILLEASQEIMKAEQSVAAKPAGRVAAIERNWKRLLWIEHILGSRFQAGKANTAELAQARYFRLTAQVELVNARAIPGFRTAGESGSPGDDQRDAGERARIEFEASQLRLEELLRARYEGAREELQDRFEGLLAGKTTADVVWGPVCRLLEAEQAVLGKDADPVAFAELRWSQARAIEHILQVRFDAGKADPAELAGSRYRRLKAEYSLAQTRAGGRRQEGKRPYFRSGRELDDDESTWRFEQEMAAVKADANPVHIAKAMLEAAREEYRVFLGYMLAGTTTADLLPETSAHRLEAELALSSRQEDQIRAREQQWRHTLLAERVIEKRFRDRRANEAELMRLRYARLDAQVALEEAKAGKRESPLPK